MSAHFIPELSSADTHHQVTFRTHPMFWSECLWGGYPWNTPCICTTLATTPQSSSDHKNPDHTATVSDGREGAGRETPRITGTARAWAQRVSSRFAQLPHKYQSALGGVKRSRTLGLGIPTAPEGPGHCYEYERGNDPGHQAVDSLRAKAAANPRPVPTNLMQG